MSRKADEDLEDWDPPPKGGGDDVLMHSSADGDVKGTKVLVWDLRRSVDIWGNVRARDDHCPMRSRRIGEAKKPGPRRPAKDAAVSPEPQSGQPFVPGYLRQRAPADWPPRAPAAPVVLPVPAAASSVVDEATEKAERRDPSEFLHCFSCLAFVEDYRHQFCSACGIRLQRTSAVALGKAWLRQDEVPSSWKSHGL